MSVHVSCPSATGGENSRRLEHAHLYQLCACAPSLKRAHHHQLHHKLRFSRTFASQNFLSRDRKTLRSDTDGTFLKGSEKTVQKLSKNGRAGARERRQRFVRDERYGARAAVELLAVALMSQLMRAKESRAQAKFRRRGGGRRRPCRASACTRLGTLGLGKGGGEGEGGGREGEGGREGGRVGGWEIGGDRGRVWV